jgi:vacuolar-type H+-ATPase subunit D/Vma8
MAVFKSYFLNRILSFSLDFVAAGHATCQSRRELAAPNESSDFRLIQRVRIPNLEMETEREIENPFSDPPRNSMDSSLERINRGIVKLTTAV